MTQTPDEERPHDTYRQASSTHVIELIAPNGEQVFSDTRCLTKEKNVEIMLTGMDRLYTNLAAQELGSGLQK